MESKTFDLTKIDAFEQAEEFQNSLYEQFDNVKVYTTGFNQIEIIGYN